MSRNDRPKAALAALALIVGTGAGPMTRAERTDYRETSTHRDVVEFLGGLGGAVVVRPIGESAGGRSIPMAVLASPAVADARAARAAGKLVVYVQADIHGGEVEGKEAALMLLRELAGPPASPLLDRLVLLVAPVFNPDGNDALGDGAELRPSQDGPERVGERASGEGLDLNRDAVKARARETRAALAGVYRDWGPDVVLDLHTTNGTRHGYALTYSPPLNPDTDPAILSYARDDLLPAVRARLAREHGLLTFDYWNVEAVAGVRSWRTFGAQGRYVTNYVGLRNRVAVLSEAASFLPFRDRVDVTLKFVRTVLEEVARQAPRVVALTRDADARSRTREFDRTATVGVRFEAVSTHSEPVPLEVVEPGVKVDHRKAPSRLAVENLPVFDRFRVTRSARVPVAYLIPPKYDGLITLLRTHGVDVERLDEPWRGPAEEFTVAEAVAIPNNGGGGTQTRLEGRFATRGVDVPAGGFVVRSSQPLGRLIGLLLEPESLDGATAWGLLGDGSRAGDLYPILKVVGPFQGSATTAVP